jgi:tetratricopeptide (TPR) repeat protein
VASYDEETNRWNGELKEFLGKYDEALDYYTKAIKASQPNKYYMKKLGIVLTQLGRLREAETQLKEALKVDLRDPETYDLLTKTYLQLFDFANAEKYYLEKLGSLGENGFTQADLAKVYALGGKREQAVSYYQKAIATLARERIPTSRLNEVMCTSYLYWGQYDMDRYAPKQAIERYLRALVLCPKMGEIHKYLGHAYRLMGDELKSLEHFSEYASVAPDAPDVENIQAIIGFLEKSLVTKSETSEVAKN